MNRRKKIVDVQQPDELIFREQYRLVFTGAIIATVFMVPDGNIIFDYLRVVLILASVFAAFYLISTAAQMKYSDSGRIYDTFYVSERARKFAFDWSVNIFGVSFLLFLAILLTGLTQGFFEVSLTGWAMYSVIALYLFAVGALSLIFSESIQTKEADSNSLKK